MGCDIDVDVEVLERGRWVRLRSVFEGSEERFLGLDGVALEGVPGLPVGWRSRYTFRVMGLFPGPDLPAICRRPRGLPEDLESYKDPEDHSIAEHWLRLDEVLEHDWARHGDRASECWVRFCRGLGQALDPAATRLILEFSW